MSVSNSSNGRIFVLSTPLNTFVKAQLAEYISSNKKKHTPPLILLVGKQSFALTKSLIDTIRLS